MFKTACPAKINLFLKVLGKRADGFHDLESLLAFTDLCDWLEVGVREQILTNDAAQRVICAKRVQDDDVVSSSSNFPRRHPELVSGSIIEISGEFGHLLDPKNNLFTKILDYFSEEFGITKNLKIKITKNIPIGGGLGGGSSNAASFMKALNEIFSLNLSKEKLQKISLNFGSDIAFFFEDKASIIKGRGEIIENFHDFKPLNAILVNPKIHLSTKEIFEKFGKNYSKEITTKELLEIDVLDLIKLPNDLEKPAITAVPIIGEIIKEIKNSGADFSEMSGSGSSCFGVFLDEKKLAEAEEILTKKFPEFFVKKIKIGNAPQI